MSLLSNFFNLSRIEWCFTSLPNPCADVRKPKIPPGRDRRLTTREERLILRYAHGHKNRELYSIVIIALATAMRQGEILGLRWEQDRKSVASGKSVSVRVDLGGRRTFKKKNNHKILK